jgi:2'-5' RNA ligase
MVLLGMQALVTLLPQPFYQTVTEIWSVLEERYGCKPEYNQPEPHFTWQYADAYTEGYSAILERLSASLSPIEIETDIVSSFSDNNSVLFIQILPSERLVETHRQLWKALEPFGKSPSLLYQPGNWIPHITLTHADTAHNQKAVREYLNTLDLQWKFSANRLTMLILDEENRWKDPQEFQLGK